MADAAPTSMPADPHDQTITLLGPDGSPIPIAVADINDYVQYGIRININYASQIGASVILLGCLFLLSKPEKRSTLVFAFNACALLFNIIRTVAECKYFTSEFYEFYTFFSEDYTRVPASAQQISIMGLVFVLLLLICIEASLILQVKAVVYTPAVSAFKRAATMVVFTLLALTAVGWRLALTVENAKAIMASNVFTMTWLAASSQYIVAASVILPSLLFTLKLLLALRRRRMLNLPQRFGPMEICFIGGCECLIIPAVFSLLQNFTSVPELSSQVLTVTAIFLPLSSLWAAANVESQTSHQQGKVSAGTSSGRKGWWKISSSKSSLTKSTATKSTGQSSDVEKAMEAETPKRPGGHGRVHSGYAQSVAKVDAQPASETDKKKETKASSDEDDDLKIYQGRSFDVALERIG